MAANCIFTATATNLVLLLIEACLLLRFFFARIPLIGRHLCRLFLSRLLGFRLQAAVR